MFNFKENVKKQAFEDVLAMMDDYLEWRRTQMEEGEPAMITNFGGGRMSDSKLALAEDLRNYIAYKMTVEG